MSDQFSFTIRIAQPVDAPEIARLNALFNDVHQPVEAYAARLADPRRVNTIFLADMEGRVIGFACLRLSPAVFYTDPDAELTELFVEEANRRQGAARALIVAVERFALEAGATEMIIQTDFYNHNALMLYRAMGYRHHDIALSKSLK